MEALWLALVVIFVAELGDKTQLLALALATRVRLAWLLLGLVSANITTQGLSAAAGGLIGGLVDGPWAGLVAAALFLAFAAWSLRGDGEEEAAAEGLDGGRGARAALTATARVFALVVVAEIGDKTMLATMTLAAREGIVPVWIGSAVGMTLAGLVAVAVGVVLGRQLPERPVRYASAALFAAVGIWLGVDALRG